MAFRWKSTWALSVANPAKIRNYGWVPNSKRCCDLYFILCGHLATRRCGLIVVCVCWSYRFSKVGIYCSCAAGCCLTHVGLLRYILRVFRQCKAVQKHTLCRVLRQPYYSCSTLGRAGLKDHAGFSENPGTTLLFMAGFSPLISSLSSPPMFCLLFSVFWGRHRPS